MDSSRRGLREIFNDFEILLEHGNDKDAEVIVYNCELIVADHPFESRAWFVASKASQKLSDLSRARQYIETALKIEPVRAGYWFQFFNLLIQLELEYEIAPAINAGFEKLDGDSKAEMLGYIEAALASGLIHKNELSTSVSTAVLRSRNQR